MGSKTIYLLFFLLFIQVDSFSQTEKDNYDIYRMVIKEHFGFVENEGVNSLILIEKHEPGNRVDLDIIDELQNDTISSWYSQLNVQTYQNNEFIQRVIEDKNVKFALKSFKDNFFGHPKVDAIKLATNQLHVQTITSRQYERFFGRKFRKIDKGWEKIYRKFGTYEIIEFSVINYYQEFATIYYEVHCGGLCGAGSIVILERVNGAWKKLAEINLWMS
ncbi:MAG: hypothetical protein DWQ02_02835 [Bacteroidetes bacterium]|nr:MAG: hypothetical protein DWQ02_02835 [Bacteroidota bacterium]